MSTSSILEIRKSKKSRSTFSKCFDLENTYTDVKNCKKHDKNGPEALQPIEIVENLIFSVIFFSKKPIIKKNQYAIGFFLTQDRRF